MAVKISVSVHWQNPVTGVHESTDPVTHLGAPQLRRELRKGIRLVQRTLMALDPGAFVCVQVLDLYTHQFTWSRYYPYTGQREKVTVPAPSNYC